MKSLALCSLLFAACATATLTFAEESAAEKTAREERVKANLAEHSQTKVSAAAEEQAPAAETAAEDDADVVTLMPEITVSGSRVTELDIEIKKLDKVIARERKKIKPTELDSNLNSDNAPAALKIFGGQTAGQRQSVAAERVNLMEAERDILEAMKHVRTKKQEEELKTQLNAFKTMRTQLEENLR